MTVRTLDEGASPEAEPAAAWSAGARNSEAREVLEEGNPAWRAVEERAAIRVARHAATHLAGPVAATAVDRAAARDDPAVAAGANDFPKPRKASALSGDFFSLAA